MFGVALSGGAVLIGVARRILETRKSPGWVGPLLGVSAYYGGLAHLLYCGPFGRKGMIGSLEDLHHLQ